MPTKLLLLCCGVMIAASASLQAQCQEQLLMASDAAAQDKFGNDVAIFGDLAVVAANFNDDVGQNSGAAYVYERIGGAWIETAKLRPSDEAEDDRFGRAAVAAPDIVAVSARYNDDVGYGSGSVYVFERGDGSWPEVAKLVASDEHASALFGTSMDMSEDGQRLAIGAAGDSLGVGLNAGAVYIFDRDAQGNWTETEKITPNDAILDHQFGRSVALTTDRVLIGATGDNDMGSESGAAYVFDLVGGSWQQTQKLLPATPDQSALFGEQVAIDGDRAVVAELIGSPPGGLEGGEGEAHIFDLQGGTWQRTQRLAASDGVSNDLFGATVAVEGDRVLVGAWAKHEGSGRIYIFERQASSWHEVGIVGEFFMDELDNLGNSMSLTDGRAIVGARNDRGTAAQRVGAAHVIDRFGSFEAIRPGCAGSGGFIPRLSLTGCPIPGGQLHLDLRKAAGGANAAIFVGLDQGFAPLGNGCTVSITPLFLFLGPFALPGSAAGEGQFDFASAVPPSLGFGALTMQAFIQDPGVPGLVSSNSLRVNVVP